MDSKSSHKNGQTDHVFVAPSAGRRIIRLVLFLAVVGLCVGVALSISNRDPWAMIVAGVSAVGLVVCWAMLQASIPQKITVRGPVIQIRRDGHEETFDLTDPGVDIRVRDGEIAFARYLDRWVVVRARDVDWKVFTDLVMYYQNAADRNAEERDRRFSR